MRHVRPVDIGPPQTDLPPRACYRFSPDAESFTRATVSARNPIPSVVKVPEAVLSPEGVPSHTDTLAHSEIYLKEDCSWTLPPEGGSVQLHVL